LGFENTYALAMQPEASVKLGIQRISDLALKASDLSIAGDFEFFGRPEWRSLTDRYQLIFARTRPMDASLMYQAIGGGSVDVIAAFSTDGRLAANDLVVLSDDRRAIPPYDAIVLVGARLVKTRPEVVLRLRALQGRIDGRHMRELNRLALEPGRTPEEVGTKLAVAWLEDRAN
jgi:osmoprotectant transport system permease protein